MRLSMNHPISTISCEDFAEPMRAPAAAARRASQVHTNLADSHFVAVGLRLQAALMLRRFHSHHDACT